MKTTQYSEALFQKQVITLLSACGYTVIEVGKSRGKTKCPSCNKYHYSTGWQGNTVGAPDLYIHKQEWHGIAIGIELKTPKGAVRKEQQELANKSVVTICRTLEDVVNTVTAIDKRLNVESKLEKLNWIL
jgi:hypothetical protein